MKNITRSLFIWVAMVGQMLAAEKPVTPEYYTEPPNFYSRPDPRSEKHFGNVGVTGLKVRVYEGVTIKVEETTPGTPAAGKFTKGDVITGVNGVELKGRNPYVVLGNALTKAEASDGRLVFDVQGKEPVTVAIPVLGAYSATWPLECKKSQAIIKGAAAYYARTLKYAGESADDLEQAYETHGIGGALACLFLLSTGDDQYLPRVKSYFDELAKDVQKIGDSTWDNGYNGIACAEYYLRTGDKSVLPVLQYYCDNARDRQFYGIGWAHWGRDINPGYTAGGLMNSAGAQVATTLVLGKECGMNVDEAALEGALKYFYRFAGHGSVAYGDHRGEGGLGSNGKDGMAAALMQVACGARGNVDCYRQARDLFGLSMVDSYPAMVTGHGDHGRGDAIWRGITSAYVRDFQPVKYQAVMNQLQWWVDLSRRPSGALGVATCQRFDDEGSGAGVAISYTAPLKTLRITGAPRSKYAHDFTLPEQQWARPADRVFISIAGNSSEPVHEALSRLGNAYSAPTGKELAKVPTAEILKDVYHHNYKVRAQAAKALMHTGAFAELEKLLEDKDPRVRRAATDGLTDYRFWFGMGKDPIKTEQFTPAMVASIHKMLANPDEAIYVVDGALLALSRAPAAAIMDNLSLILPWTTNDEWWVRQSAFMALAGAAQDEKFAPKVLPTLADMLLHESRAQARQTMSYALARLAKTLKTDGDAEKQIVAAFERAAGESVIRSGPRAGEGEYNVVEAASASLAADPGSAVDVARIVKARFPQLGTGQICKVVAALLAVQDKLPAAAREELAGILYGDYRQELIRRLNKGEKPLDTILSLTLLKHPDLGWREVGKPAAVDRVWQFTSFEPQGKDVIDPRLGNRFRDVALPAALEKWFLPEFDASKWSSGKTPIGKGVYKHKRGKGPVFENRSAWGDGEFLLARTTFEIESVDCDFYRLSVLANRGYHVYLNGEKIYTYIWWQDAPIYRAVGLGPDAVKFLKKGTNVLAVYAVGGYVDGVPVGQLDLRIEGLKQADLLKEGQP